jgi:hypothetical protein
MARKHKAISKAVVALSAGLGLAAPLAGCGAATPTAGSIVHATLAANRQIASGNVELSFILSGSGASSPGGPVVVRVSGPFEAGSAGQLPRFNLNFAVGSGGQMVEAGATYTGKAFYVQAGGEAFEAPQSAVAALQAEYAHAAKDGSATSRSPLAALGLNPGEWLEDPTVEGEQEMEGIRVVHVHAKLNVSHFFADAGRLSGVARSLGGTGTGGQELAGGGAISTLLSPEGRAALSRSVKQATVDIYCGKGDHLLRALTMSLQVAPDAAAQAALGGLKHAKMEVSLRIAALNRPQRIGAPSGAQSISEIAGG